jgi:acid stress-induced BolA-like protein IbaG/YrbA
MAKRITLTKESLARILATRLSLKDPQFKLEEVGGRLVGNIISSSFKGKRDYDRQKVIWDALDAELGREAVLRIGMLLAYTPEEWEVGSDEGRATKRARRVG